MKNFTCDGCGEEVKGKRRVEVVERLLTLSDDGNGYILNSTRTFDLCEDCAAVTRRTITVPRHDRQLQEFKDKGRGDSVPGTAEI